MTWKVKACPNAKEVRTLLAVGFVEGILSPDEGTLMLAAIDARRLVQAGDIGFCRYKAQNNPARLGTWM